MAAAQPAVIRQFLGQSLETRIAVAKSALENPSATQGEEGVPREGQGKRWHVERVVWNRVTTSVDSLHDGARNGEHYFIPGLNHVADSFHVRYTMNITSIFDKVREALQKKKKNVGGGGGAKVRKEAKEIRHHAALTANVARQSGGEGRS